jgi:hypothetical protein
MKLELKEPRKSIEWTIHQGKDFSVTVRGWTTQGLNGVENRWNVYANVFDNHPFFGKIDALLSLHFHGGPTFEKLITTEPAQGVRFDFERINKTYKIGSDYSHAWDNYEHCAIDDGIPPMILQDAEELAMELLAASSAEVAA